jgi:hypothetical protein
MEQLDKGQHPGLAGAHNKKECEKLAKNMLDLIMQDK